MPLPWRVEMFGGLRVVQSDRTITRFQTQKTGALLAYLCLHKQSAHSREVLAEMLWPGADPVAVRNRLNQAASSLRRQLEPPGIIHGSVLITDQRTIRVNAESIETDVEEFARYIARAESCGHQHDKQSLLKKAIDLYVGDFLSGHYIEWITVEQLRFSDLYTGALFDLLDVSREIGDVDQAIRAATLLVKDDPTDEGTHCDLMRLYLDAGRPAAAKRQFEELTRILAAEEETPSDEAYELNREASSKRAFSAKPMQVIVKETVAVEPFSKDESTPGLPSAPNRFVGREVDITKLKQMLAEDSTRLITITGMGGCGKTRLALQLAHGISELISRNTFFVPLADLREARQIDEAIASAIGIREAENIVRRLRQNDQTFLVLDNIEHLVEEGAHVVQSLLESVPSLKLLITSRCPLKIDAERSYQLSPLPSPSETIALDELSLNPSVALFVDRAQAALPDFQLTARNADVVRKLCQRLDGLPLAIELAASWAKTVAPAQMLSMLTDRFTLLESRRRDINARHRTMRAVIDSGVDLLPGDLKTLFHRLSVFHGGWTLESASFVCQRPDVLYAMESLVEQSLIQSESVGGDTLRFRMLDTLNDYADEHVPSAEKAETSNLHAEYFSKLSEEAARHLGGRDQASWLNRLDLEIANLTAAFHWYLDHDLVESALVLANNMAAYWEFRGRAREGRRWMEAGLSNASTDCGIDPKVLAEAKTHLARLIWIRGDFEEATRWHEQCLNEWISIGDSRGICYAQINIQMEAHRNRDYSRSIELLNDNLRRATELDDQDLLVRTWLSLGNTAVEMRQFEDARNNYEQSLKVARLIGNEHRIASALNNLGNLAMLSKQFALARHSLSQALEQFESLQAKSLATESLILLAKLERFEHNAQSARFWLAKAWSQNPDETYNIQALFKEYAHAAASRGDQLLATTLLGFVERLREESGALNYDIEQEEFDDFVTTLRGALSDQVFNEAWTLGRTLELGQAVNRIAV